MAVGDPQKFGDCMWRRHEYCKVTLESGIKCSCDCDPELHGSKFVPGIVDTPMHRMLMKAGRDNGYPVTEFDDKIEESETIEDLEKKRANNEEGINP